jgi:hypothetical protein
MVATPPCEMPESKMLDTPSFWHPTKHNATANPSPPLVASARIKFSFV